MKNVVGEILFLCLRTGCTKESVACEMLCDALDESNLFRSTRIRRATPGKRSVDFLKTIGRRDAAAKSTRMYLRRVFKKHYDSLIVSLNFRTITQPLDV